MQHEWRTIINGVSHQPLQAEKSHDGAGPRNQRQLQILQERHLIDEGQSNHSDLPYFSNC